MPTTWHFDETQVAHDATAKSTKSNTRRIFPVNPQPDVLWHLTCYYHAKVYEIRGTH